MEILTLALLRAVASTCLKVYLASLLGGGGSVIYRSSELGYKVPKWYMNPGQSTKTFYAYGTSVNGDEFDSIDDARQRALEQMANHIRLSNRKIVSDEIRFDESSLKQKRLVELFVRSDGLEDFIRMNAELDKKQLVKVQDPQPDMRAFVRLALPAKTYIEYQTTTLKELETNLMRQKTDDILAEIDSEQNALGSFTIPGDSNVPGNVPPGLPTTPVSGADSAFDELENEIQ